MEALLKGNCKYIKFRKVFPTTKMTLCDQFSVEGKLHIVNCDLEITTNAHRVIFI